MDEISKAKLMSECTPEYIMAVNDTMNVIIGKWKIPIIAILLYGKCRYKELEKAIPKISPSMLSKELRELESNGVIIRTVRSTVPVTVEYELSESGQSFKNVLLKMVEWGIEHRENFLRRNGKKNED